MEGNPHRNSYERERTTKREKEIDGKSNDGFGGVVGTAVRLAARRTRERRKMKNRDQETPVSLIDQGKSKSHKRGSIDA